MTVLALHLLPRDKKPSDLNDSTADVGVIALYLARRFLLHRHPHLDLGGFGSDLDRKELLRRYTRIVLN